MTGMGARWFEQMDGTWTDKSRRVKDERRRASNGSLQGKESEKARGVAASQSTDTERVKRTASINSDKKKNWDFYSKINQPHGRVGVNRRPAAFICRWLDLHADALQHGRQSAVSPPAHALSPAFICRTLDLAAVCFLCFP